MKANIILQFLTRYTVPGAVTDWVELYNKDRYLFFRAMGSQRRVGHIVLTKLMDTLDNSAGEKTTSDAEALYKTLLQSAESSLKRPKAAPSY